MSVMQLDAIRELYDYNHWANQRVLSAMTPLTDDMFTRNMGNSFVSLRDTLAHILGAEWIWLERWLGRSPKALLSASDFPTLQALQRRWAAVRLDQNQYIQTLVPDRLNDEFRTLIPEANATPMRFGGRCFMCSTIPVTIAG